MTTGQCSCHKQFYRYSPQQSQTKSHTGQKIRSSWHCDVHRNLDSCSKEKWKAVVPWHAKNFANLAITSPFFILMSITMAKHLHCATHTSVHIHILQKTASKGTKHQVPVKKKKIAWHQCISVRHMLAPSVEALQRVRCNRNRHYSACSSTCFPFDSCFLSGSLL